jgi:hypothetical protein
MNAQRSARWVGRLLLVLLVVMALLPIYVGLTFREVRRAEHEAKESMRLVAEGEKKLSETQALRLKEEQDLAQVKKDLWQKKSDLAEAKEKFREYEKGAITCAQFAEAVGRHVTTPTERSHDVATVIRRLRDRKDWSEASKRAKGWLEFHRSSPSNADNSALVEVALLWKRLGEADPRYWEATPYKTRQELLLAANELFEEVGGKASAAKTTAFVGANAYIAGNWGTLLMDLANLTREQREADRIRQDSAHLLDIAIEVTPKDDVWRANRIYVEMKIRRTDPAGFASYCERLAPRGKIADACGRALYGLVKVGRPILPTPEIEHLACQAARWAHEAAQIQKECDQARQRMRRGGNR